MKPTTLVLLILAISFPLAAQTSQPSLAVNRIVAPIDDTNLVSLHGNIHPLAQARYDRGPAPVSTPTGRLTLVLQPSAVQQQGLTQYLADLQNPSSPSFHKWLTPAQYGATYGISEADLETVEGWLESHGFKIERVPQGRNLIQFSGSFDEVQNAFHTSIHMFAVHGETHFANVTDPEIPAALAPVVVGLAALNDFFPKPYVKMGPKGRFDEATHTIQSIEPVRPDYTSGGVLYVVPADASTIYNTPNKNLNANFSGGTSYDGTGVKIGIAGDSNINAPDVTNYRTAFLGASASSPNDPTVVIDGNDPGANGDEVEALLDTEVAGGLAPGATLYFYTSADTDLASGLFNAVIRAIDDNTVSILNISFGNCEANEGSSGNSFVNALFEQAAAQGISVTVSMGDSGSAGCDNDSSASATQGFGVNALASTPYAIAVGGTDFDVLLNGFSSYVSSSTGSAPYYRTANKYIPENPWNDSTTLNGNYSSNVAEVNDGSTNIVAAGGGKSTVYSKPSFQTSVTSSDSVRDVPDVSFMAGNGFYGAAWLICADSQALGETSTVSSVDCANSNGTLTGTVSGVGGTSAAAPAFAGMLALVAQAHGSATDNYRLGQVDYVLYQLAKSKYSTVFHDVTTGNNSVVCSSGSTDCGTNGFLTGYNAGSNYDYASGLGSVNISALVSNWGNATLASTTTTLNIGGSTSSVTVAHGTALTFNVGVTPASATGVAAIVDNADETSGGATSGPQNNGEFAVTVSKGTGSATYNGLPGGSYTVSARYGGDASDAASTSTPPISVTISKENSSTSLAVNGYSATSGNTISGTSFPYGSQINMDATIAGTSADEVANGTEGLATGTVTFLNGSTTLGTAAVASQGNQASWPPISNKFTVLAAGSYSATASYSGDASFNASTSSGVAFTVTKATTTTAGSANPTSLSSSAASTVTVTITTPYNYGAAGYGAGPTGTVTLTGNGKTLATITNFSTTIQSSSPNNVVLTGTGTIQGSALASGSNTITATYSGDGNYAGSSGTFTVTLSGGGTSSGPSIALSNSGAITVTPGATTGNTSTITVTPGGGFTGAVNLSCSVTTAIVNPTDPPTCTLSASSVTISGTTAATATVTANTTGSSSSALDVLLKRFLAPAGGAALAMVLLFGIPARRRGWRMLFSVIAVILVISAAGCGGSSGTKTTNPGTTAGAYTVTVNGADAATGKITSSTTVTLTVN